MGKSSTVDKTEWMYPGEAARLLGVCLTTFKRRSLEWGIRVRMLPGVNRRYVNRADVARVLAAVEQAEAAAVTTGDLPPVLMKSRHHEGGSPPRELQTNGKGTARTSDR